MSDVRSSESIASLAKALAAAQAEMPNAPKQTKGQVGNAVRYYSDLATVTDVVRPILAKHQLAYVQLPAGGGNGTVSVATRLVHESGEWIEATLSMPTGGNGAQGVGSAITYARRYSLMAVLGLAPEDDDGAAASTPPAQRETGTRAHSRQSQASGRKPATTQDGVQMARMHALFGECDMQSRDDRLAFASSVVGRELTSSKDLTPAEVEQVVVKLEAFKANLP